MQELSFFIMELLYHLLIVSFVNLRLLMLIFFPITSGNTILYWNALELFEFRTQSWCNVSLAPTVALATKGYRPFDTRDQGRLPETENLFGSNF